MNKLYISLIMSGLPALCTAYEYKSQCSQDRFVHENFFLNKRNGTFVDIGAYDGVRYSNSYFFEKELGWTGICIEPLPNIFEQLKRNRSCSLVNKCVSSQTGYECFIQVQDNDLPNIDGCMLSGIARTYDPRHLERAKKHAEDIGGSLELLSISSITLNELLKDHNMLSIDFLSIDTEGSELDILKSIDFETFYIHVIAVENNFRSPEIKEFLTSKNFVHITTLDVDEIYCNAALYKK